MAGFIDSPRVGWLVAIILLAASPAAVADDHPGKAIYQEHCVRCHGEYGAGTADQPDPLVGDRSINQLAASIDETMPEDDPSRVDAEAARQVAEYIHGAFYSAVARDRNRPARVEPCRLTMRQYQNTVADLLGRFRGGRPGVDDSRGLKAEYFRGRSFDRREGLVYERVDPQVDFDFGLEGPEPEQFEPNRFAIRWTGSIVPPETGVYEFVVRSAQAVKLSVNSDWDEPSLIDAMVTSAGVDEYRGSLFLLGGRAYPLRLEFSKATQGVEKDGDRDPNPASIRLLWKPPHGVLETLPEPLPDSARLRPQLCRSDPLPAGRQIDRLRTGHEHLTGVVRRRERRQHRGRRHGPRPCRAAGQGEARRRRSAREDPPLRHDLRRAGLPAAPLRRPAGGRDRPGLRRGPRPRHGAQAVDPVHAQFSAISLSGHR